MLGQSLVLNSITKSVRTWAFSASPVSFYTFRTTLQGKVVDDIDLIPGSLAEIPVEGSLLGPTYICLIGRQFKKTRKGDRFWYEMADGVGAFTRDQLVEIYKSNMARIICDNSDRIENMQKSSFIVKSANNPVLKCEEIPKVDLSKWKAFY
ncbi:peroxidase [Trichonephila clavata]|uniref:Peroxidase n=1 Tax=Trichonephila clavata TaxID=2740835 RepID=A0A8X6ID52_TRICU|nr:peroxidase [Trichonephila clavata]